MSIVRRITRSKPAAKRTRKVATPRTPTGGIEARVEEVLATLERLGKRQTREEMGPRYGIYTKKAFGVAMSDMQRIAKEQGRSHELAAALWATGWYEARTVAAFVEEPALVTPAQMDRWCRDFDNWGICDTVCFHLFDRTPHAFAKIEKWARAKDEFVKRASFALLASVALHDKAATDAAFLKCLPLLEEAASDERNFVKKSVLWALRSVGRRSPALNAASVKVAKRLAVSEVASARWIGKPALRYITSTPVRRRSK